MQVTNKSPDDLIHTLWQLTWYIQDTYGCRVMFHYIPNREADRKDGEIQFFVPESAEKRKLVVEFLQNEASAYERSGRYPGHNRTVAIYTVTSRVNSYHVRQVPFSVKAAMHRELMELQQRGRL